MTKKYFKIGNVNFTDKNCVLIAEAGVNHNGNLELAEELIKAAKKNGADIIKFQTYKAESLTIKNSPRFWSWDGEKKKNGTQYDSYSLLDKFNEREYKALVKLCKKYKIEFMSTPFDLDSVDMLVRIGAKGFKVASCDLTNFPLLKKIAKKKLPILLSTGASNLDEVKEAVNYIKKFKNNKICIMHCTLCYPTKPSDVNLSAIIQFKKEFKNELIGLSDHTLGIDSTLPAVALGVRTIEKHFTVNKKLKKSADHWLSIDPKELLLMRKKVDNVLLSIGKGGKKILRCEHKTRLLARRSLVLKRNLVKGTILNEENLVCKRPGNGISPKFINKFLGKKIIRDLNKDHQIKIKDIVSI